MKNDCTVCGGSGERPVANGPHDFDLEFCVCKDEQSEREVRLSIQQERFELLHDSYLERWA